MKGRVGEWAGGGELWAGIGKNVRFLLQGMQGVGKKMRKIPQGTQVRVHPPCVGGLEGGFG
jgi:hypothetical protein